MSAQEVLVEHYAGMYGNGRVKSDSPDKSRGMLVGQICAWLRETSEPEPVIVDLGSGPQPIEKAVKSHMRSSQTGALRLATARFVTIDSAPIDNGRLMQSADSMQIEHITADVTEVGLPDADLVIANHSIDMLDVHSPQYHDLLSRIGDSLRPGGLFVANFHHASLFDNHREMSGKTRAYYDHFDRSPFYESPVEVMADLRTAGFDTASVAHMSDGVDVWLHAEAAHAQ